MTVVRQIPHKPLVHVSTIVVQNNGPVAHHHELTSKIQVEHPTANGVASISHSFSRESLQNIAC